MHALQFMEMNPQTDHENGDQGQVVDTGIGFSLMYAFAPLTLTAITAISGHIVFG